MNPISPYQTQRFESSEEGAIYEFTTNIGVAYRVVMSTAAYFAFQRLLSTIAFVDIRLIRGNPSLYDQRIRSTIEAALLDWLSDPYYVLIFICDNNDGRGAARHRKFISWFRLAGKKEYYLDTRELLYPNGEVEYVGAIINIKNPERDVIEAVFDTLSLK